MGTTISIFAEVKNRETKKWEVNQKSIFPYDEKTGKEPFDWTGYSAYAFFAGVRNYKNIVPISEVKELPEDSKYLNKKLERPVKYQYDYVDNGTAYTVKESIEKDLNNHSRSFLTLKELAEFNYEKPINETENETYREFLGENFFEELERLKTLGEPEDVRIIFWFD